MPDRQVSKYQLARKLALNVLKDVSNTQAYHDLTEKYMDMPTPQLRRELRHVERQIK